MICRPKLKIHAWYAWQRNPWKLAVICLMALSSMSVQAQGQDYANPQMAGAAVEYHHLYRIPLTNAKPHEVLQVLRGAVSSYLGPFNWGSVLQGIDYIIPVERDHSFLIMATVDGFNLFKEVVRNIDVPTVAVTQTTEGPHGLKPIIDPTLPPQLKQRQRSLHFIDGNGGIPLNGPSYYLSGSDVSVYHMRLLNAPPQYVLDTLIQIVSNDLRSVKWYNVLAVAEIGYVMPDDRTDTLIVRATTAGYADFKDIVQRLGVHVVDDAPLLQSK